MKNVHKLTVLLALATGVVAAASPAFAQDGARREAAVDRVQENQQDRIAKGIASGQLRPGEATRLERGQASIERQSERLAADGRFSRRDARTIEQRQQRQSHAIYGLKHNGRRFAH